MSEPRRVLVLGASGYVGGRLVPRLLAAGHTVRCLARSPGKLQGLGWSPQAELVAGDLLRPETLGEAFADVDAVFHLVHSMGSATSFADADRRIARTVAASSAAAGVRRIVYLGGLGDVDEHSSGHLRSRAEVGDILMAGPVATTILRAAVIIGSGSASFEMLRHLVEKLPVMVTPKWVGTRVQPIAIRDVLRYLVGVLDDDSGRSHVYDIGGPDVLTYREMMRVYAEVAGLPRRLVIPVPLLTPWLSSLWVGLVTPVPTGVAKPLVGSLTQEVVVDPARDIAEAVPGGCLPYIEALRLALSRVQDQEVQTSWRDAELRDRSPAEPYPGDPQWAGGTLFADVRNARSTAPPQAVFAAVSRIGGTRGWPTHAWAWAVRGWIDLLVGGVGLRRGRRDPDRLRVGDALDFWRVEELREPAPGDGLAPSGEPAPGGQPVPGGVHESAAAGADSAPAGGLLRLRAEMRLPGRAWLEFQIEPDGSGSRIRQRALFAPRGLFGRAYWWVLAPFHGPIFGRMVRWLAADAERLTSTGGATVLPEAHGEEAGPPSRETPPT